MVLQLRKKGDIQKKNENIPLKDVKQEFENIVKESKPSVQALYDLFEKLYESATKDELTGAYNRKAMEQMLGKEVADAIRHNLPLCVIMVDIDNFKKYNDSFGHLQGDEALRTVTRAIDSTTRTKDFVARYGGEEFLIALPNTHTKEGEIMAERIRKSVEIAEVKPIVKELKKGYEHVTISLGVTEIRKGESVKEFLDRADTALYKAKRTGKNKIVIL